MFKDELDVIFLGLGVNTLSLAYECASQNRRVIIIYDNDELLNIKFPYYIWDDYLDSRPFLKYARKNKISEFIWKGNKKSFKFEINDCWKLNSIKLISILKKELKKYNISIIKSSDITLDFKKNIKIKTDGDTFDAPLCVADVNCMDKIDKKMDLNIKKFLTGNSIYNTIENIKGFPITTDDININNVIVETPGFDTRYQVKIISNSIFPIHESEVIVTLGWLKDKANFDQSKILYLNELWVKYWKRKRNENLILNNPIDIQVHFYNIMDLSPNNRLLLLDAYHDQLNCSFLGYDISKSFKLAEIFTNWLDFSIKEDNFNISSMEFYLLNTEDASLSYDLYKNARFQEKCMNHLADQSSEKIDEYITSFLKKVSRPKFLKFLKGTLPNKLLDDLINEFNM